MMEDWRPMLQVNRLRQSYLFLTWPCLRPIGPTARWDDEDFYLKAKEGTMLKVRFFLNEPNGKP